MSASATRRHAGATVLGCGILAAGALAFFPSGWVINRLNVQIWWFLRQNTPMARDLTPEDLALMWNVFMFVPLGVGLALILPRWWWVVVLCGLSIAIETTQLFFFATRHPDIIDVAMNTIGAGLGVMSTVLLVRWCEKRRNESIDSRHG